MFIVPTLLLQTTPFSLSSSRRLSQFSKFSLQQREEESPVTSHQSQQQRLRENNPCCDIPLFSSLPDRFSSQHLRTNVVGSNQVCQSSLYRPPPLTGGWREEINMRSSPHSSSLAFPPTDVSLRPRTRAEVDKGNLKK